MNIDDLKNFAKRGRQAQIEINKILGQHTEATMADTANFKVILNTKDFVLIEDVGPHDQYLTVTNAAETVVRDLISRGKVQTGQRLFYLDSDKEMDELEFNVIDGFQRFKSINLNDELAAICHGAWKQIVKHSR